MNTNYWRKERKGKADREQRLTNTTNKKISITESEAVQVQRH